MTKKNKVTEAITLQDIAEDDSIIDILSDDEAVALYEEAKHVLLPGNTFTRLAAKAAESEA